MLTTDEQNAYREDNAYYTDDESEAMQDGVKVMTCLVAIGFVALFIWVTI